MKWCHRVDHHLCRVRLSRDARVLCRRRYCRRPVLLGMCLVLLSNWRHDATPMVGWVSGKWPLVLGGMGGNYGLRVSWVMLVRLQVR